MTPEIERHYTANAHMKKKDIMLNNLLGGIAWGFGSVVGASLVVGTLGYIFNKLGILSAIGSLFGN